MVCVVVVVECNHTSEQMITFMGFKLLVVVELENILPVMGCIIRGVLLFSPYSMLYRVK